MQKSNSMNLSQGSIFRSLLLFSLPLLVGQVFQTLYNSVDSIVVGNAVGTAALAAVTASGSIASVLSGFFNGLSAGTTVLFARHFGAGDYNKLKRSIHTAIPYSLILGAVMALLGVIFTPQLLRLVSCPEDVYQQALLYLRIYLVGVLFTSIYNVAAGVLRAVGDSRSPFYYLVISSLLNIVLDILFVVAFQMGVLGVAFATVLAQFVSVVLAVCKMGQLPESYRFRFKEMAMDGSLLRQINSLGLPSGLQNSVIFLSAIFIQRYINQFGSAAIAGVGAGMRIDQFAGMPCHSLGLAMTTYIGQNVGARRYDRTHKGIGISVAMVAVIVGVLAVPMYIFAPSLARIFGSDPAMIEVCTVFLRTILPLYFFMGLNGLAGCIIRGYGYSLIAMIISIFGIVVVRQVWLAVTMGMNPVITNIFVGYPIGWIASVVPALVFYLLVIRKRYRASAGLQE